MAKRKHVWNAQFHAPANWSLESYGLNDGPAYPQCSKKGNVGAFFRALQTKELYDCTKGIFAPVRLTYDASAENLARFNRETAAHLRTYTPIDGKDYQYKYEQAIARKRALARIEEARRDHTTRILSLVFETAQAA